MPRIRLSHILWAAVLMAAGVWLGYQLAVSPAVSGSSGLVWARIDGVVEEGMTDFGAGPQPYQLLRVEILSGDYTGSRFTMDYGRSPRA